MTMKQMEIKFEDEPKKDEVHTEAKNSSPKPRVAAWSYKNSNEDFERLIIMSMEPMYQAIAEGTMTEKEMLSQHEAVTAALDVIFNNYNVMPKTEQWENRKPANWDEKHGVKDTKES